MNYELSTVRYLTEKEVARQLSVSVKWLQKMRLNGGGIPFAKFGSAVRYSVSAVAAYEAAAGRNSTSDQGDAVPASAALCNTRSDSQKHAATIHNLCVVHHDERIHRNLGRKDFPNG